MYISSNYNLFLAYFVKFKIICLITDQQKILIKNVFSWNVFHFIYLFGISRWIVCVFFVGSGLKTSSGCRVPISNCSKIEFRSCQLRTFFWCFSLISEPSRTYVRHRTIWVNLKTKLNYNASKKMPALRHMPRATKQFRKRCRR